MLSFWCSHLADVVQVTKHFEKMFGNPLRKYVGTFSPFKLLHVFDREGDAVACATGNLREFPYVTHLTGAVHSLDILFRFAHKIPQ